MTENKKIPLLVYIVFHPESENARKLAHSVHKMLNDDPAIPGLRIPTLFAEEDGTGLPPAKLKIFDQAEQVFAIVLADDYMAAGYIGTIPDGRKDWGSWVAELYDRCKPDQGLRCIPFQLSKNAFPLDQKLELINFPRIWFIKEELQTAATEDRIIIELVRFLQEKEISKEGKPRAPLKIFISHTKYDLGKDPKVVCELLNFLHHDNPVDAWFDSGDIPAGSNFSNVIEQGVENTVLLSVLTDTYVSREWCRKEILLAKKLMRPIVVIDALQKLEARSFPYIGNVPVLRWNNNPHEAIYLLLKETLRQLHIGKILSKQIADLVLTNEPELAVIIDKQNEKKIKNMSIIYPDPPLGLEEMELIKKTGVEIVTPLQRFALNRFLDKTKIAVSLSEGSDPEKYGFDQIHFDQIVKEISRYLLLAGATLCYGGHLGDAGYTVTLFDIVRSYNEPKVLSVKKIISYIGWPLALDIEKRAQYKDMADFITLSQPADISDKDALEFIKKNENNVPVDPVKNRFAWARGMTEMRKKQTDEIYARVAMGGKIGLTKAALAEGGKSKVWYQSRIPGILEEVFFSMQKRQPVYLIGGFGGCARMVADVICDIPRKEMSEKYQNEAPYTKEIRKLYKRRGQQWISYKEMTDFLQKTGIAGLNNNLSPDENIELFETINPARIIELLLKGLKEIPNI